MNSRQERILSERGKEGIPSAPICTVLTKEEFLNDFTLEAENAKDAQEVFTMVMNVDPLFDEDGNVPKQVVTIFEKIPSKTTRKRFRFDAVSRLSSDEGGVIAVNSLLPLANQTLRIDKHLNGVDQFVQRLKGEGVEVMEQNLPEPGLKGFVTKIFPFTGREHKKASYIKYPQDGKDIFYLPSANYDSGLTADTVLKFRGDDATLLIQAFNQAIALESTGNDAEEKLTDKLSVYIDSGTPNKSIILDRGIKLVREAKESIQLCSWLYPDGIIAEELESAKHRQVKVDVLTTKMRPSWPPYSGSNILFAANKLAASKPHSYNTDEYEFGGMHSKMLIVDGRYVFVGSNNLSEKGRIAGTSEFQVLIDDTETAKQLVTHFYDFRAMIAYDSRILNSAKK